MKKTLTLAAALVCFLPTFAQTVTVKDTVCTTYPFSDPDPVPRPEGVYPYYRLEGFSTVSEQRSYTMVVLENDCLRVKIFPEIGGKIWSVYDKVSGNEMFYDNDVVKFRDIALRGPWTSGGIEFNYGIIGHAPSCAAPVEYSTMKKADGSVSCFIGSMDLLTRTRWRVEINLPSDAAYLRTSSFWHNGSGAFQPYYTWANSGVTASDDLKIIYPGAYTIGHDGITASWPFDEQGRDLSEFQAQAFGIDKSFHPGGTHKNWFGAYYRNSDFGMLHYALRDEKIGRKYFSWAQSPQGEIWKELLTDGKPQYVELQSGRLFNQNLIESIYTPYKQTLFTPFGSDSWDEYWLPFSGIGEMDEVCLEAVVNMEDRTARIYPLMDMDGKMVFADGNGKALEERTAKLTKSVPMQVALPEGDVQEILMCGRRIWSADKGEIDRPSVLDPGFDSEGAYGQTVYGQYLFGMRKYGLAKVYADKALDLDGSLIPALVLKSMLCLVSMDYEDAYNYANKVLAIDEYHAEANYLCGVAATRMGKINDAMDRYEVAAISYPMRSAACTALAELHLKRGNASLAAQYAKKALVCNAHNVSALETLYQCEPSEEILATIESLDPLGHFPEMEKALAGEISMEELEQSFRGELVWQNYLEYAAMYLCMGLGGKAAKVLAACPEKNCLVALWEAYVSSDSDMIVPAESLSIDLVFPFREESADVLEWACENGGGWKSRYLKAMLMEFKGHRDIALELLRDDDSDHAPYYAFRGLLTGNADDYRKAISIDDTQWRYHNSLALVLYGNGDYPASVQAAERYYKTDKANFHVGETLVRGLVACGRYKEADKIMSSMHILPFEGQQGSHVIYRDIKLHLAAEAIEKGRYAAAEKYIDQAEEWPERLGVGKPYDELVDNSEEENLRNIIRERRSKKVK